MVSPAASYPYVLVPFDEPVEVTVDTAGGRAVPAAGYAYTCWVEVAPFTTPVQLEVRAWHWISLAGLCASVFYHPCVEAIKFFSGNQLSWNH